MANVTITQLSAVSSLKGSDEFPIGRDGTSTNKVTYDTLSSTIKNSVNYTDVGNPIAGIFVNAVCFIPLSAGISESGSWVAPENVFKVRVTLVGGGGACAGGESGGRSHFNYPTGITPVINQLFAEGGNNGSIINNGGSTGWNNVVLNGGSGGNGSSANNIGKGGKGGSGGGGYGGGGGGGGISFASLTESGGGGSYGSGGYGLGSGGSGGICGDGGDGFFLYNNAGRASGNGGGTPILSYAATILQNFATAISKNPGRGGKSLNAAGGGGGGWCSAIVSVIPGQIYQYTVGYGGVVSGEGNGSDGMVVIEW